MTDSRRVIFRRILAMEDLPTLPEIPRQIIATVADDHADAAALGAIIERDPVLAARVLRLANSAFFGARHRVDAISRAVVLLGFDTVHAVAVTGAVLSWLQRKRQPVLLDKEFWLHAFGAAKAGQLLAERGPGNAPVAVCYMAGLLHDLGKYLLALALGEQYRALLEQARSDMTRLWDVEMLRLRVTHAEVGGWILEQWNLPPLIAEATRHQYTPELYEGPYQREVMRLSLVSNMARMAGYGAAGDYNLVHSNEVFETAADVSAAVLEQCLKALGEVRHDAHELLEVLRTP